MIPVFALMLIAGIQLSHASEVEPSPALTPESVVTIVLDAMANNDQPSPDAGIAQAFRFASPKNRASLGPYWHFVAVVKQPAYAPLLNHSTREMGAVVIDGNTASIPIMVVGKNGEVAGFMWSLSKQTEGDYLNSWMTDGVARIPLGSPINAL